MKLNLLLLVIQLLYLIDFNDGSPEPGKTKISSVGRIRSSAPRRTKISTGVRRPSSSSGTKIKSSSGTRTRTRPSYKPRINKPSGRRTTNSPRGRTRRPQLKKTTRRPPLRERTRTRSTKLSSVAGTTARSWDINADPRYSNPYYSNGGNPYHIYDLAHSINDYNLHRTQFDLINRYGQFQPPLNANPTAPNDKSNDEIKKGNVKLNSSNDGATPMPTEEESTTASNTHDSPRQLIVFAQIWPRATNKSYDTQVDWVISGLRLSDTDQGDLENCTDLASDNSIEWDDSVMDDISDDLMLYWYDTKADDTDDKDELMVLWQNAWETYGTCGLEIDDINTIENYFNKVIDLAENYNLRKILTNNTIVPNNAYSLKNIQNAISNSFESRGYVSCNVDDDTGEQELEEIYLCFDDTFKLTNCDGLYESKLLSNCDESTDIKFS